MMLNRSTGSRSGMFHGGSSASLQSASPRRSLDAVRHGATQNSVDSVVGKLVDKDQYFWHSVSMHAKKEREKLYSDNCCGRIAKHRRFEQITIATVLLNTVEIGWDVDYTARFPRPENLWEGPMQFRITSTYFAVFFSLEILIRFFGYCRKRQALSDLWFLFDFVLVAIMVTETFVLPFAGQSGSLSEFTALRTLRLLRIARVAKLLRAFPQLLMIVKGIRSALKATMWSGVLMILMTLTTAIVFTGTYHQGKMTEEEVAESGDESMMFFGSLSKAMVALFVMGTILDDVTACSDAIRATGNMTMLAVFIIYILMNSFTLLNMLTGILVEVVGSTTDADHEKAVEHGVIDSVAAIWQTMDADQSGRITRSEFVAMMADSHVIHALEELGIREKHFQIYLDLLFQNRASDGEEESFDFQELMQFIARLRPGVNISALDFAAFKSAVLQDFSRFEEQLADIDRLCASIGEMEAAAAADPQQPPPGGLRCDTAPTDCGSCGDGGQRGSPAGSGTTASVPGSIHGGADSDQEQGLYGSSHQQMWPNLCEASEPRPKLISSEMVASLEGTSSCDIIHELARRIGVPDLEESGIPMWMIDDELRGLVQATAPESFCIPGAPDASELECLDIE